MNLFYFQIIAIAIIAFITGIYIYCKNHSEKPKYTYPWRTWFTATYMISCILVQFIILIGLFFDNVELEFAHFTSVAFWSFMPLCLYINEKEISPSAIQLLEEGKYRKFVTEYFRNYGLLSALLFGCICWWSGSTPSFLADGEEYWRIFGTTDVKYCGKSSYISSMVHFNGTDYRVKSIGFEGYHIGGNNSLEHIVIQHGITTIEDEAFSRCHKLVSIVIPESVTEIGDEAFSTCFCLTSITIPKNVKSLGEDVFEDCNSLETIRFEGKTEMEEPFDFLNDCKNLSKIVVPYQYKDYYCDELLLYAKRKYHRNYRRNYRRLRRFLYFSSLEEKNRVLIR